MVVRAQPWETRRFSVDDYHRMGEAGILGEDDRVELIEGDVVAMPPIGSQHAGAVDRLAALFQRLFGDRAIIRVQNPVRLSRFSEPQPDLALLRPREDYYAEGHPGPHDVLLLIEVSDTTLRFDREVKAPLYGRAGVPEMWILDLGEGRLERFRSPNPDAYAVRHVLGPDARVAAVAFPNVELRVGDLFGS